MGLYVKHLETISFNEERSLYVYLLNYGWSEEKWEQLFRKHFMHFADLASESGAVVIGSPAGIHFANQVLSWHKVGTLSPDRVLPGLLITRFAPLYFKEGNDDSAKSPFKSSDIIVIPLKDFCVDEDTFLSGIRGLFEDLKAGLELNNFRIATADILKSGGKEHGTRSRIVDSIELKPGAFGLKVDLMKLFGSASR